MSTRTQHTSPTTTTCTDEPSITANSLLLFRHLTPTKNNYSFNVWNLEEEAAHTERQMLDVLIQEDHYIQQMLILTACATIIHDIPIEHLQVLGLPVHVHDEDDGILEELRWVTVLVHPKGMRKVLVETIPHESGLRVLELLLNMMQKVARKKLFGDRIFMAGNKAEWRSDQHAETVRVSKI
jgi:hypothetical protein